MRTGEKHKEQAMVVYLFLDSGYLFLDSGDSTVFHPRNTPDDFIVTFTKPYVIDDSWECAILELLIRILGFGSPFKKN